MTVLKGWVRRQAIRWGLYALVMFVICAALTIGFLASSGSGRSGSRVRGGPGPELMAVITGALALFAGYHVVRNGRHLLDPDSHPAVRAVGEHAWGPALTAALDDPAQHLQVGKLILTGVALVDPGAVRIFPYDELLWAYPHQLTQKLYGVITTAQHHSVVLATRDGKQHKAAQHSEEAARRTLLAIHQLAPWVELGYSASLEAAFKRSPAVLAAVVDQRRAAAAPGAGTQPAGAPARSGSPA